MMSSTVKPIPDGYQAITPYLIVDGAASAIEFYQKVFGAIEVMRLSGPDGKVGHAELLINDARIMLADEFPQMGARGPRSFGGSPVRMLLYVDDVDAIAKRAVAAGAKLVRPIEDQFYGDRAGGLEDPFGHHWHIATHIEDVSAEEMQRRAAARSAAGG
jgi:PhnB protein